MASVSGNSSSSLCSVAKQLEDQEGSQVSEASSALRLPSESTWEATSHQLSAALSDTSASDEFVKQHMKLAEEAIAGWEKAEAEVSVLKERFEATLQQKLAAEQRVSHLDGALKECMKQLRYAREEQEQKVHDAVMKKSKEWEESRTGIEAKLVEAKNELCKAMGEKQAIEASLQQMTDSDERKNRLLVVVEKENAKFRSELLALGKEIDLRNKERELNRRAAEAAQKQNLDRAKKIAKLEEDCQKLRLLAKNRIALPGSIAASNEPREADTELSGKKGYKKGSPCLRTNGPVAFESGLDGVLKEQNKLLSDRIVAMEKERTSLKAQLVKRDNELQEARLLCARTANKPSDLDKQFDSRSCSRSSVNSAGFASLQGTWGPVVKALGSSSEPSTASFSADDAGAQEVSAESWASALITELAHIKQEKKIIVTSEQLRQSVSLNELMDDFAEMEKLASLSSDTNELELRKQETRNCAQKNTANASENENIDIKSQKHLLNTTGNAEKEGDLASEVLEATTNGNKPGKDEEAQQHQKLQIGVAACISYLDVDKGSGESKFTTLGAQLAAAVRNVLDIAEGIAQTDYTFAYPQWLQDSDSTSDGGDNDNGDPGKQWKRSGLDSCAESLVNLCNSLVQGKVDVIDFIAEMASALDWMVGLIFSLHAKSPDRLSTSQNNPHQSDEALTDKIGDEVISARDATPAQLLPKGTLSNEALPDQSSVSNLSFRFSEASTHEEELAKVVSENAALKVEMEAETWKIEGLQNEISQLKFEYSRLENDFKLSDKKLADVESERHEASEKVQTLSKELLVSKKDTAEVQSQLADALDKIQSLETAIAALESQNFKLDCQLCNAKECVADLEKKLRDLEEELKEEVRCREQIEQQFLQLEKQHSKHDGDGSGARPFTDDELASVKKEQEMVAAAEKLAECQQTILALGKQLKALGAPTEVIDATFKGVTVESSKNTTVYSSADQVYSEGKAGNSMLSNVQNDGNCADEEASASSTSSGWSSRDTKRQDEVCGLRFQQSCRRASFAEGEELGGESGTRTPHRVQRQERRVEPHRRSNRLALQTLHDGSLQEPGGDPIIRGPSSLSSSSSSSSSPSSTAVDAVPSSPSRSPARFLSLRPRNGHGGIGHESSKHGDPDEKHGSSGLSRFFARTRRENIS